MRTRINILIAAAVLLTSCGSKSQLSKLWSFTHVSAGNAKGQDTLLTPASFLFLNSDGSYTRDFGQFEYGTWEVEDKQIFLKNQHGKNSRLAFELEEKEMKIRIGNGAIANFESLPALKGSDNPFVKENNLWRIRPQQKETDQQIKERLYNHCKFWENYFTWALEKDLQRIDVRSTPTLIKIYSNGFSLKPYKDLPPTWWTYFYDSADCKKATDQMTYIFDNTNIAWGNTENKFKMFIGAFQQLGRQLD